jgi:hypothetical protein
LLVPELSTQGSFDGDNYKHVEAGIGIERDSNMQIMYLCWGVSITLHVCGVVLGLVTAYPLHGTHHQPHGYRNRSESGAGYVALLAPVRGAFELACRCYAAR